MELNEKLQELRKQKGLTQEELSEALYVSRTAISKWESGRGYPNIDSLKAIARFFSVSIDDLLSGEELLTLAEEDTKQKQTHFCNLVFALLDISIGLFLFLPLFAQKADGIIYNVPLLSLNDTSPYLHIIYLVYVSLSVIWGILMLAMQNCIKAFWKHIKNKGSLVLTAIGTLVFIISLQPYAATLLFVFLMIKVLMLVKKQ